MEKCSKLLYEFRYALLVLSLLAFTVNAFGWPGTFCPADIVPHPHPPEPPKPPDMAMVVNYENYTC